MVTKFVTQFNYVMPTGDEPVDDTLIVERAGYIPAKKQIEALIYSGQNLVRWRMEEFGGKNVEEAENDYLGIDSCRDFVDIDNVLRKHAEDGTRNPKSNFSDDDGKRGDVEPMPVSNTETTSGLDG